MVTGGVYLRVPYGKYFHGVTRVEQSPRVLQKAYLSSFWHCSGVCLHDTFHISNIKKKKRKKDGKASSVFKQPEKEVCSTSPCRWERRGMRNVKQMSGSSAPPEMAEQTHPLMLVHTSCGETDGETISRFRYLLLHSGCTNLSLFTRLSLGV